MKLRSFIFLLLISVCIPGFSQDESWEPQKQITGYISTEGNYFPGLNYYDREYGISLAEAGILVNYLPLRKLTIKGVFVYRPGLSVDQMLNEFNAEWSFNSLLNLKAGRFLTPLSPVNTYFYSPVNLGVSLPVFVSHHELYPLTMDGFSINGIYGDNLKLNYNLFGGGYYSVINLNTGPVGFFGFEDVYFRTKNIPGATELVDRSINVNSKLHIGAGGHIGFSYNDLFKIGFNGFQCSENFDFATPGGIIKFKTKKWAIGTDIRFKYKSLQISGEKWYGEIDFGQATPIAEVPSTFIEISNSFGKLTPFIDYEEHCGNGQTYSRYKAGLNYKPIFETTFKIEYLHYIQGKNLVDGIAVAMVYSF